MSEVKVIGIGNDHAAVDLKNEIKAYLEEKGLISEQAQMEAFYESIGVKH